MYASSTRGREYKEIVTGSSILYVGRTLEDDEPGFFRRHVVPSTVDAKLLFTFERKGFLNMRKLKQHGLTRERLLLGESLLFYQLLHPLHLNSVDEAQDMLSKRKNFYTQTTSWYCWRQIKANLKLNYNLEEHVQMAECKHGTSKFNYAYKFDYIYAALVHNMQSNVKIEAEMMEHLTGIHRTMLIMKWEITKKKKEDMESGRRDQKGKCSIRQQA
eukprot:jgi/Psemu1/766/gm1.766_g